MPTLLWRLILRLYQAPVFIIFRSFWQIRSSLDDSTAVSVASVPIHLSTQLAFNESSVQWLGLSCTSNIAHLHCLQVNFSNYSIGSLSNSVYSLNLPPWPSKPCTPVVRHISLTSCIITNLRDLCAHPVIISFRSPVTTYLLDLVLFDFPLPESGIHYLSASANHHHQHHHHQRISSRRKS